MNRSNIAVAMLLLPIACGGSSTRDSHSSTTPGVHPAPAANASELSSFEGQHFTPAKGVVIDPGAARLLPAVTAGALTVGKLASFVNRAGLDNHSSSKLHALRKEVIAWLGFDLVAGRRDGKTLGTTAAAVGIDVNRPMTLAWLYPDAEHVVLVLSVTDGKRLRRALGSRPAIIAGDRVLLCLGRDPAQTRKALADMPADLSLASSGKLDVFDAVAYGADAALYLSGEAYGLGAKSVAMGLTLRADSLHVKAVAQRAVGAGSARAWATQMAKRMGAVPRRHAAANAGTDHSFLRELERSSTDALTYFAAAELFDGLGLGGDRWRGHKQLSEKLGGLAMAGRGQGENFIFYGSLAFDGASSAEIGNLSAKLAAQELRRRPARARELAVRALNRNGALARLQTSRLARLEEMFGGDNRQFRGRISGGSTGGLGGIGTTKGSVGLDSKVIRSRIRRHSSKFKYCYEKQLLVAPKLHGTVRAKFTIGADGKVSTSTAVGMDTKVSACIARVIGKIRFPRPRGGAVHIRYPFVFSSGSKGIGTNSSSLSGTGSGGLSGGTVGVGSGLGGSIGAGGGGSGIGTIGTGSQGTIGRGGGPPRGYGRGGGGGSRWGRGAYLGMGKAVVKGSLDRNIIRRYVRRAMPKLKRCYEKQLVATPKLGGVVTVRFTIGAYGRVSSVTAKGVHKNVASCARRVIQQIRFPKPRGGGVVRVSYPFNLNAG